MRIAIDATFRMHGGGMIHIRNLLAAWQRLGVFREHKIVLFTRPENLKDIGTLSSEIEIVTFGTHEISPIARVLWQQFRFPRLIRKMGLDVLFCPGGTVPLRSPIPTVVAFRNAAPFCSSVNPRTAGLPHWLSFKILGLMMKLAARYSTRVLFISHHFRDLFVKRFGFPIERADIVYHGCDALRASEKDSALLRELGIGERYILSVSHLYRYKNMPVLIEGYALAQKVLKSHGLQLAIVGKVIDRWHYDRMRRRIQELGLQDWILLPGPVAHDRVGALLKSCHSFVFQSTCENCPNTLIEALAAAVPVATSNASVMPEIGGDAVLYFDPFEAKSIAAALTRLTEDDELRRELIRKASERAKAFPTWDEVGRLTLDSLTRAASLSRSQLATNYATAPGRRNDYPSK